MIGGMGSLATAHFLEVLALKCGADRDQDHIPYVALSLPDIPDRSFAISTGSDRPFGKILERARWLESAGCGAVAIPCNTAHFWAPQLKQNLTITLIDLIDATTRVIRKQYRHKLPTLRLILLGTNATMEHNPYREGIGSCPAKDPSQDLRDLSEEAATLISDVKSGRIGRARRNLSRMIHDIRASYNPDVIVLGCSELSAISGNIADDEDVIDPIDILADASIAWWRKDR
ncbi:amino acid racemase [Mesorhizobium sp.]|uniref:aspartate/glutamate racemase family protein n=1 Tax=Mesorhizobium sp. TaxID=1871066 RepID=UPI0025D735EC|nr:amino acid racemase [Mesorhizobium sp.]